MFNILIYIENISNVDQIKGFINKKYCNINFFIAYSYNEAVNFYNSNSIDIIISELFNNENNVLDLLSYTKSDNKDVYFILFTDFIKQDFIIRAVNNFVDKIIPTIDNSSVYKKALRNAIDLSQKSIEYKSNVKLLKEYKDVIDDSALVSKTNKSGVITYVNDSFCKISGYSRDELLGHNHNIIRSSKMNSNIFKELWSTILSGNIWRGEVTNHKKDGELYTVLATINPIYNIENEIEEFIAVRHDITNEVRLREYMTKQLEEKDFWINQTNKEIVDTQREMILTLGEVAETRSQETGLHVKRVSEYSYLLATLYGLNDTDASILRSVSPMHDVGKVGIPDSILNKPGKLTPSEFELMKEHAVIGYEMLNKSDRPLIKSASIISHEHHEKWNGTGYPNRKKGEDIHIFARITAIADVFDALGHDRVYKKAWPIDDILKLLKEESGKHFDPKLIDIFFANLSMFLDLKNKLSD